MFCGCYNLINLFNYNTSNVLNICNIFYNCYNLQNVENFDTTNVTDMSSAFFRCSNLQSIPNFDTNNILNMRYAFYGCSNLRIVPEFNTNKVVDMIGMFTYCYNLSNNNIQTIVNMCINSNVPSSQRNLNNANTYSPLYDTRFDSTYYSNRLTDLTNAGWSY